jgi:hypothetical protein
MVSSGGEQMPMDLVFYGAQNDGVDERLRAALEAVVPGERITVCRTLEQLSRSLVRPLYDLLAVVLLINSDKELTDILAIQHLLWDVRVILLLPDRQRDTIARGHRLRPRFLTFADGNSHEVAAVLAKMMRTDIVFAEERNSQTSLERNQGERKRKGFIRPRALARSQI